MADLEGAWKTKPVWRVVVKEYMVKLAVLITQSVIFGQRKCSNVFSNCVVRRVHIGSTVKLFCIKVVIEFTKKDVQLEILYLILPDREEPVSHKEEMVGH